MAFVKKKKRCLLVDYGVGNVFSIRQAVEACGFNIELSKDSRKIKDASHVILPGVGAFSHAIKMLETFDLIDSIQEYSKNGGNLLGICVGMQLLFSKSYEHGEHLGLNIIDGEVASVKIRNSDIRVPIIGWHPLLLSDNSGVFDGIDKPNFYFVHSYECLPRNKDLVAGYTQFDQTEICASVVMENTVGVQFHPEKSGESGLRFLSNFVAKL